MAKTPTLTCTTEYGTFKRQTHRKYTHVVITCGLQASGLQARAAEHMRELQRDIARYENLLRDIKRWESTLTDAELSVTPRGQSQESYFKYLGSAKAELEGLQAATTLQVANSMDRVTRKVGSAEAWCGSLDLARKAARQYVERCELVMIAPVDVDGRSGGPIEWVRRSIVEVK